MRLNKPTDEFVTVIRFTSSDTQNIKIPYGDNMPNPAGGNVSKMTPPFTGNGFTAATNGEIVPEFYTDGVSLQDGAEMFQITSRGEEKLIAVYDEDLMKFVRVD